MHQINGNTKGNIILEFTKKELETLVTWLSEQKHVNISVNERNILNQLEFFLKINQ